MHTPTMTPAVYSAGHDLKLMEFRGADLAAMELRNQRVTIQVIGGKWYVLDGNCCALCRQNAPDPIAFTYGLTDATPSPTAEDALALFADYLNQPLNPYAWANQPE